MAVNYIGDNGPDGQSFGTGVSEKISFYGVTPVVQQATAAAGTDAATTQTLANALRTMARAQGLMA